MPDPTPTVPFATPATQDLWDAIDAGSVRRTEQALAAGADPNATTTAHGMEGLDALMRVQPALTRLTDVSAMIALINRLLDAGANPLRLNPSAWADRSSAWTQAMGLAGEPGSQVALHLLERCPALLPWHEAQQRPPLCVAILRRQETLVNGLLAAGANPNLGWPRRVAQSFVTNPDHDMSPLRLAVQGHQGAMVRALLAAGAVDTPGRLQEGVYEIAIQAQGTDREALVALLDHGYPLTPTEQRGVIAHAVGYATPGR